MSKRIPAAAALLVCAFSVGAEEAPVPVLVLYQIDLIPSGKMIAKDLPTLKGTNYLLRQYPTGTLVSVRKSTVKQITKMSPEAAAAANPLNKVTRIRDLPMQGPKQALGGSSGGRGPSNMGRARAAVSAANSGTAGRTSSPPEN